MKKYRFHLLGLAHLPVSERYPVCAYTQKIVKLSRMLLSLGHKVYLYGAEGSDVECSEFIETHKLKDICEAWGDGDNRFEIGYDWKKEMFRHDLLTGPKKTTKATKKYYKNCIKEINKRKKKDDFLLITQGVYQKPIDDGVKLYLTCETGIGYRASYCKFKAFESAYLQNFTYGSHKPFKSILGNSYDAVIPNYFDPTDFTYNEKKSDYFLYIGRLIKNKGVETAHAVCKHLGENLFIAGQGVKYWDPDRHVLVGEDFGIAGGSIQYMGCVGVKRRAKLYADAKGVFVPTRYLEPFGGVSIEALFSGTPVITTNFGVFPETILDGVVGYRCNTLQEFVNAAKNINKGKISSRLCRDYAMSLFSMKIVAKMYQEWFDRIYPMVKDKRAWYLLA